MTDDERKAMILQQRQHKRQLAEQRGHQLAASATVGAMQGKLLYLEGRIAQLEEEIAKLAKRIERLERRDG